MPTRKALSILALYAVIAIAIMAPVANHQFVPRTEDYVYHLQNIIEARHALLQGQIWLRIAPNVWQGMFYPVFQFYAPTVYTIAGVFSFISQNPLDAFRLTLALMLILGGWYSYKLYVFLFRNEIAAILGGMLYLFSPYLLININVRGDLSEAATQAFFPVILYYAFRIFKTKALTHESIYFMLVGVLSVYILATSHLITFLVSSLFLGLLFLVLAISHQNYRGFLHVFVTFIAGLLMASWYLIPLVGSEHWLNIGAHSLFSPWNTIYFTQLATLLSIKAVNIAPWLADLPLYPGIGLPVLLAVLYWIDRLWIQKIKMKDPEKKILLKSILILFLIAFFLTWSPFDFWKALPHVFYVVQFPYRFLTLIMWLGGILIVACLVEVFKRDWDVRYFLVGSLLIAFNGSLWMNNNYEPAEIASRNPQSIQTLKDLSTYKNSDYLVAADQVQAVTPEVSMPSNHCQEITKGFICVISLSQAIKAFQLPILYYPGLLNIQVNGRSVTYFPSNVAGAPYLLAAISLPAGQYVIKSYFRGNVFANTLSIVAWLAYLLSLILFFCARQRKNHDAPSKAHKCQSVRSRPT